jgi:type I restriction enzyme S subunit
LSSRPVQLSEVCTLVTDGTHYSPVSVDGGGVPFLTVKDMHPGRLDFSGCSRMSTTDFQEAQRANCAPMAGDVLFSKDGTVGKVHVVDDETPFAVLSSIAILRCDQTAIVPEYLGYALQSSAVLAQALGNRTGTALRRIILKDLKRVRFPLPPIPDQRRIVDILRSVNGIHRLRKEAQDATRQIIPALFVEMFGDPVTNPKGWPLEKLGDLGTLDRGRSRHRPRNDPRLYGGPYPFIQTGDVANSDGWITKHTQTYSEEGLRQSKLWAKGTLCITIAANIADTGILAFDACFPDSVVGFKSGGRVGADYIQGVFGFLRHHLDAIAPQLAQKNINLRILRDLKVPVPPMSRQRQYVEALDNLRSVARMSQSSAAAVDCLRHSLMSKLFA